MGMATIGFQYGNRFFKTVVVVSGRLVARLAIGQYSNLGVDESHDTMLSVFKALTDVFESNEQPIAVGGGIRNFVAWCCF
jgi:hypothetical protein